MIRSSSSIVYERLNPINLFLRRLAMVYYITFNDIKYFFMLKLFPLSNMTFPVICNITQRFLAWIDE